MSKRKVGVLVMSYGTPEDMDQVEAYYTHIRRGNPPSAEQLQELKDRYSAIGGLFPLRENTNKQVNSLEETLNTVQSDIQFICYQGCKHAFPFIEDGIKQMVEDGINEAVGVVLAPHYSIMSVGGYIKRAKDAAEKVDLPINFVKSYHLHPFLVEAWAKRVQDTLSQFKKTERENVRIIFSAHSLPEKIVEMNDPYPEQLLESSKAIIESLAINNTWQFAWQSAGQTATPWLGPDILEVLQTIRKEENVSHALICPIGFVSDHLEILYDIDIECKNLSNELGMHVERIPSLNTDPKYMQTLAEVVINALSN